MNSNNGIKTLLADTVLNVLEVNNAYREGRTEDSVTLNLAPDTLTLTVWNSEGFETTELTPDTISDMTEAYVTSCNLVQKTKTSAANRRAVIKAMLEKARDNLDFDCGIQLSQSVWTKMFNVAMEGFEETEE